MHTTNSRITRLLATALMTMAVAVAISACGGDDDNDTDGDATASTPTSPTSASTADAEPQTLSSQEFGIPLTVTIDGGWTVVADAPDILALEALANADGPFRYLTFVLPVESHNPTGTSLQPGPPPNDFVAWFNDHPYVEVVSSEPITLGGLQGTRMEITADNEAGIKLYTLSDGDYELEFRDRLVMIVLNADGQQLLVSYGSNLPANFPAAQPLAEEVLRTVQFGEPAQ